MKHEFTDTQLRQAVGDFLEGEAIDLGTSALGEFFWTQQVKSLRKMLNALPEPTTDDWQECPWMEYKPGDRMMQENDRATIVYKSPIRAVHENFVELEDKNVHHFQTDIIYYRIPAPVTPPDPLEHPVIIVHKTGTVIWDERPAYWNPEEREYVFQDAFCTAFLPVDITEWEPAKVVAEDDR